MDPKEALKAVVRNPWVQRGVLIGALFSTSGACARPETRPTPPPAPTAPAKPKEIPRQTVPTPQPTEVPKPAEKRPTTSEEKVGNEVLDLWKREFKIDLAPGVSSMGYAYSHYLKGMTLKERPGNILQIDWDLIRPGYMLGRGNYYRIFGQLEIASPRITQVTSRTISQAQKLNNPDLEWQGEVLIEYAYRCKGMVFSKSRVAWDEKDLYTWLSDDTPTEPPRELQFSQWSDYREVQSVNIVKNQLSFPLPRSIPAAINACVDFQPSGNLPTNFQPYFSGK